MVVELTSSSRKVTAALLFASLTLLSAQLITTPWIASFAIPEISNDPELLRSWRHHPANPQYRHQLSGRVRHYSIPFQDYQEALHEYRLALRYNPLSSRTWFDVARVQGWMGNIEEAKRAIKLAYDNPESDPEVKRKAEALWTKYKLFDQ